MQFASESDKYARVTVSLDGVGVPVGGGAFFLECGLFFMGTEGSFIGRWGSGQALACALSIALIYLPSNASVSSSGPVRILASSKLSDLNV